MTAHKICKECGREKSLEEFNLNRKMKSGRVSYCRPCHSKRSKNWRLNNLERYKKNQKLWYNNLRDEIIKEYGGCCSCCGVSNREFLNLDHIGGKQGRHKGQRGNTIYLFVKQEGYPKDKYRLLCWNCNLSIGQHGYCPHASA